MAEWVYFLHAPRERFAETMTPEEEYLARQWPLRCRMPHGAAYLSLEHFRAHTEYMGTLVDAFGELEMRNCSCGTTLSAVVRVIDLSEE